MCPQRAVVLSGNLRSRPGQMRTQRGLRRSKLRPQDWIVIVDWNDLQALLTHLDPQISSSSQKSVCYVAILVRLSDIFVVWIQVSNPVELGWWFWSWFCNDYVGQFMFIKPHGSSINAGWWFGTWILFFQIYRIIIPIDFHIFQRGRYTTSQNVYKWVILPLQATALADLQATVARSSPFWGSLCSSLLGIAVILRVLWDFWMSQAFVIVFLLTKNWGTTITRSWMSSSLFDFKGDPSFSCSHVRMLA